MRLHHGGAGVSLVQTAMPAEAKRFFAKACGSYGRSRSSAGRGCSALQLDGAGATVDAVLEEKRAEGPQPLGGWAPLKLVCTARQGSA